jgi:hypothetical protein
MTQHLIGLGDEAPRDTSPTLAANPFALAGVRPAGWVWRTHPHLSMTAYPNAAEWAKSCGAVPEPVYTADTARRLIAAAVAEERERLDGLISRQTGHSLETLEYLDKLRQGGE